MRGKYKETQIAVNGLTRESSLALGLATFDALGWQHHVSGNPISAIVPASMRSWGETVTLTFDQENLTVRSACHGDQNIDWGKNKSNLKKFTETFETLRAKITQDELNEIWNRVKANHPIEETDPENTEEPAEETGSFIDLIKPGKGYVVTPVLLLINLAVFLLMWVSGLSPIDPDLEGLIKMGANYGPNTLDGQWWRLITCMFMHIGVFHLLFNLYALLYIGSILEPLIGSGKFLAAYLLTGVLASASSLWWDASLVSAGASGAIFGMYGVFLTLLLTKAMPSEIQKAFLGSMLFFVGYNLINGLNKSLHIDNAAHIGGLIGGLVFGLAITKSVKNPENRSDKINIPVYGALVLGACLWVLTTQSNDIVSYEKHLKQFMFNETRAVTVYNAPQDTNIEKLRDLFRDTGLYYYKQNLTLADEMGKLNVPDKLKQRTGKLKEYCNLKIQTFELIVKALSENTNAYDNQIQALNAKTELKLAEINKND